MNKNNQQNQLDKKLESKGFPKILTGLLPITLLLISSILSLIWYIIDYQVEALVDKRTSEYAHSIVKIAADSSAEALLSDDKLQLELLTQNVAKDRYIKKATVYSADGIIVTEYPEADPAPFTTIANKSDLATKNEIAEQKNNKDSPKNIAKDTKIKDEDIVFDYLAAKKNIPFIEKIAFKGVTAGWFKLEIDGLQLESDFREKFSLIRLRIFALFLFLVASISFFIIKYKNKVNHLVSMVHLLVKRKLSESQDVVPTKQSEWLKAVNTLANASFSKPIRLREQRQHVRWSGDEVIESLPMIWLSVDLPKNDGQSLSKLVVKIEKYLKEATNSYLSYFQGEIFSGGIVPFFCSSENTQYQSDYSNAIEFIYLFKSLIESLDANVTLKAIVFNSRVNKLYTEDIYQNRVIIPQRKRMQINRLTPLLAESEICCLLTETSTILELAYLKPFVKKDKPVSHTWIIKEPNHEILNQVARLTKTISDSDRRH